MNLKHRHSFKRKCPPFALNDFFSQKVFTEKSTSTSRQQEMVLIVEPPSSPLTHAHTHTHTRTQRRVCKPGGSRDGENCIDRGKNAGNVGLKGVPVSILFLYIHFYILFQCGLFRGTGFN